MSGTETDTETAAVPQATTAGGTLRWAVRLLFVEAVALGVLGIGLVWLAIASTKVSTSSVIATCVITFLFGAIVGGLAHALRVGSGFARSPAIVLQILMLPMGYYMIDASLAWLGVPVIVLGLAGTVLLLAPSTRSSLGLDR